MSSLAVASTSVVNAQTNRLYVFAVNADNIVSYLVDPDVQTPSWLSAPTVPGSAVPVALTATYRAQSNAVVLTVVNNDNSVYSIVNPLSQGAAWVAQASAPTT